jgi:ubiquinone/menaquinone biosynthesis C-methylase UbiE
MMTDQWTQVPIHLAWRQFLLADITQGMTVLDVGCGQGGLMSELAGRGCSVTGVEIDSSLVRYCQDLGLRVSSGRAEALPVADSSLDAVVCSVVLPYTDERLAVGEWARVLKPGGTVNVVCHGVGYGLEYLLHAHGLQKRLYGLRMLANSLCYSITGQRLPGFLGDTLCQTSRRLRSYYRDYGLRLERVRVIGVVMGCPQFLCHRLVKNERGL